MNKPFVFQSFFDRLLGMKEGDLPLGYSYPYWLSPAGFARYIDHLKESYFRLKKALPKEYRDAHALLETKYPLSFNEFSKAIKGDFGAVSIPSAFHQGEHDDYLLYLINQHGEAKTWFRPAFPYALPMMPREAHTYIVGESGSGKSVLLYGIVSSLLYRRWKRKERRSVMVIDPHGSLAEKCARSEFLYRDGLDAAEKQKNARYHPPSRTPRQLLPPAWWEAKDLAYINPSLGAPTRFVTVNPLDISGRQYDYMQIDAYVSRVVNAFTSLLAGDGNPLTIQMSALLVPCVETLLHRPHSTFRDLKRFMDDSQNSDLVSLGKNSPNEEHRHFFGFLFPSGTYTQTKRSIATKLQTLLNDRLFQAFIAGGPSTVDLEAIMNQGHVGIVNLACFSQEHQEAAMRLLVGMTLGTAKARKPDSRLTPTDLIIDEAELGISADLKDVLAQARKFGLHLTLAQQVAGQGMSSSLEAVVLGNTAVKIVGKAGYQTRQKMARELFCSTADFDGLGKGTFLVKAGDHPFLKIGVDEAYARDGLSISSEAFMRAKEYQLSRHYREPRQGSMHNVESSPHSGSESSKDPRTLPVQDSPRGTPQNHAPKYQGSPFAKKEDA